MRYRSETFSPQSLYSSNLILGYDTSFKFPFPIVGRNGIDIRTKWSPHPKTYLAMCVDGFPNWFFSLGPNSGVGSGSLLALIEKQVDYAVQVAMKMKRERLKSVEAKREAVEDYDEYIEVCSFNPVRFCSLTVHSICSNIFRPYVS